MTSESFVAAKQSLALRLANTCLTTLFRILPRWAYDRMYFFLFLHYKNLRRDGYRRKALRRQGADAAKIEVVHHCLKFSLVGWQGMEVTYDCTKKVIGEKVPGALVECGVAQGAVPF